jgi:hypothetical protein
MHESAPLSKSTIYLTADAVERRYGLTRYLLKRCVKPSAWLQSGRTEKKYPVWSAATIEAYIEAQGAA